MTTMRAKAENVVAPVPWSQKHWQEAVVETGRLIAEAALQNRATRVLRLAVDINVDASEQRFWREKLAKCGYSRARIEQLVQLVRDLAEGRATRETDEWHEVHYGAAKLIVWEMEGTGTSYRISESEAGTAFTVAEAEKAASECSGLYGVPTIVHVCTTRVRKA